MYVCSHGPSQFHQSACLAVTPSAFGPLVPTMIGMAGSGRGSQYADSAYCEPRPDPAIPIMVGTNGPKALGVTARHADWWNWDGPWEQTYMGPYEILRQHCEAIGRPFEEITLTSGVTVWMPDDPAEFEPTYEHRFYPGQTFHVLGPTPEDVIREVELLVDHGVQHFQAAFADEPTLDRFIRDVVPN